MSCRIESDCGSIVTMSALSRRIDDLITGFSSRRPIRTGSLIMTVFGDSIAPRGGSVWLTSLISLVSCFGLGERLIRTSAARLASDAWLNARIIGRQSLYSLTASARTTLDEATAHIYQSPHLYWDGRWNLALLSHVQGSERELLRKQLQHVGFGCLSPEILAHPTRSFREIQPLLPVTLDVSRVLSLNGSIDRLPDGADLRSLATRSWPLVELDERYQRFGEVFKTIDQRLRHSSSLAPKQAFQVRTLLIHEYRKIALRDPKLPEDLLPKRWRGFEAYRLCGRIYARTACGAEQFVTEAASCLEGELPPPDSAFFERFSNAGRSSALG